MGTRTSFWCPTWVRFPPLLFFSISLLGMLPSVGFASLKEADAAFEKGLYQKALEKYSSLIKTSRNEEARLKSAYRASESEALLFRYGEAVQRLEKLPLPKKAVWRARFLILKTELYREYLKQYGRHLRDDVVEGDLTPGQLRASIEDAYWSLWGLRKGLLRTRVLSEAYFIDVEKSDEDIYPTLWDFVLYRWTGYLLEGAEVDEKAQKPAAISFIKRHYRKKPLRTDSPIEIAGALLEEGARGGVRVRARAREKLKLDRLLLGFQPTGKVIPFKDFPKAALAGADILKKWSEEFRTSGGRASAGYEAAVLYDRIGMYTNAVSVCADVQMRYAATRGAKKCAKLLAKIRRPELSLRTRPVPPPGRGAFTLNARNLEKVFFKLYETTPEELLAQSRADRGSYSDRLSWSQALNHLRPEQVKSFLERGEEKQVFEIPVSTRPYARAVVEGNLPDVKAGLYILVASGDSRFEPGESLLFGSVVNVTGMVLLGSAGLEGVDRDFIYRPEKPNAKRRVPGFHFYAVDGKTGKAAVGAQLKLMHFERGTKWGQSSISLDQHGRAQWPIDVNLQPGSHFSFQADPLVAQGEDIAYWPNPLYLGFSVPAPIRLFAEIDRPIYRPGQTVRYKLKVVERTPLGWKTYRGKASVAVVLRDAHYKEIETSKKNTNAHGSLSGEFRVPTGRSLGNYTVGFGLTVNGQKYAAQARFGVEEYKRPEFEVTLDPASDAWRFGKEASLKGSVRYYFGGAVPGASVTYRVLREDYRPWFCWWWRAPSGGQEEILSGETATNKKGEFVVNFTPHPKDRFSKDPRPARYIVKVAARDSGGRTLHAEKTYLAGKSAYLFSIDPETGFAIDGKISIETRLVNLGGDALTGEGEYALYRLEGRPENQTVSSWNGGGRFPATPSLEVMYRDVLNGPRISMGHLDFQEKGARRILFTDLNPGAYRLTMKTEDPWGETMEQSIILLSADGKSNEQPFALMGLSLPERKKYLVGETAQMLMGSSEVDALTHVEVWGGRFLLKRIALSGGGVRLWKLPLTRKHKGGVTVRWFGVKDFKAYSGALNIEVPWKEKNLDIRLQHDTVVKPGEALKWSLIVRDHAEKTVFGEATVRMYDRALEYYAQGQESGLKNLYAVRPQPSAGQGSQYEHGAVQVRIERGVIKRLFELFRSRIEEPLAPGLRLNRSRLHRGYGMLRSMAPRSAALGLAMADDEGMSLGGKGIPEEASKALAQRGAAQAENKKSDLEKESAKDAPAQARSNFSETAVFAPHVPVRDGIGRFSFTAPEKLTSWRIAGDVVTPDVKLGDFSEEAVTRKDLMVRIEMPRFFREGDEGTLKAIVHNETDEPLQGSVKLRVEEGRLSAEKALGISDVNKKFNVAPHSLQVFSWAVRVPRGMRTYTVSAAARSGKHIDAEERVLPVYPSRQRLIESVVASLNGTTHATLALKSLSDQDPSRISESLQLQVEPQLILTILNSLPFLVNYPYRCVEQALNRYIPLAIVNALYEKHPAIARAAQRIPTRETITPAWEKDDSKRLTRLAESPWLSASEGRKSIWPIINLFNKKTVEKEKQAAFEQLSSAQLSDGGFPWFPGGRADPYMTLYVLGGLSEARHYGVAVPVPMIRRALGYVMREMPRHMKPEESQVALLLYAAYVVTSFPEELGSARIQEFGPAAKMARAWLEYADKHAAAMTQLGEAYAAYAYHRLGKKKKSDLYLRRALDGSREDPVAGVYWQPEKKSWLWYHDTLETHAFILRMLQTVRPKDRRIPGLVQWLLFNRKGTEWKSTKASAAAIYTLLDFMKGQGALEKGDSYSVAWGEVKETKEVSPEDWLEKPLRWTRRGMEISPEYAKPDVEKRGPGLAFASVTHVYTTEKAAERSLEGMLNVRRTFYRRVKRGKAYHLEPLDLGAVVRVGEEIEVRLKIDARSQFEYVHINDPRGAGFESEALRSGWKWDQLGRYEEPRDTLTNFFMSWLPHGEYNLRYRIRPTTPGVYRIGAAVLQSMYAPEFAAHSSDFTLKVVQ